MPKRARGAQPPSRSKAAAPSQAGRRAPYLFALAAFTILLLLPFSGKAFHIDDPLFVWAAKHIQTNPLDPYGFNVNWYGFTMKMSDITKNPPLTSYYMAGWAGLFGWGERSLHIGYIAPVLIVVLVTYLLAELLCGMPLLAAALTLATPVVLVSSTTVMSDMWMLALWMSSVYLWITGLRRPSRIRLLLGSAIIALAAVAKYFAMALIPLLLVFTLLERRRLTWDLAYLILPVTLLALYQAWTHELYGRGLLLDAAAYASEQNAWSVDKFLIGAAFTGGCLGVVCLFTRWCGRWPVWGAIAAASLALAIVRGIPLVQTHAFSGTRHAWPGALVFGLLAAGGLLVLAMSARELILRRDAVTTLLALWVLGTFVFASSVNWTTNGRSILPLVPAAAILLVRAMQSGPTRPPGKATTTALVSAGVLTALAVTWADVALADSARSAARALAARYGGRPERLLFEGHWGFQYYMQAAGAVPVEFRSMVVRTGDIIVIPENNTNTAPLPENRSELVKIVAVRASRGLATMSREMGAAFYADVFGPLPFALGEVPRERYYVYRAVFE